MSSHPKFRVTTESEVYIDNLRYIPGEYVRLDLNGAKYLLLSDIVDYESSVVPLLKSYSPGDRIIIRRGDLEYSLSESEMYSFFFPGSYNDKDGSGDLDFSNPNNSALIAAIAF